LNAGGVGASVVSAGWRGQLRRIVDWTPVTPAGFALLVGAAGWVGIFGVVRQDRFLLAAGAVAAAMVVGAALVVVSTALSMRAALPRELLPLGDVPCERAPAR
jgi:hypothetical protein